MKHFKLILQVFSLVLILATVYAFTVTVLDRKNTTSKVYDSYTIIQDSINTQKIILRDSLAAEIGNYISSVAKNSPLDPNTIIDLCIKHDFDITLLLSQAHIEGHFGTKGRPKTTGSVFGVGLYDNGTNVYTYANSNQSIEPYIKLVKNRYMKNGTLSVDEMLRRGYIGYASNPDYSRIVSGTRNKIKQNTKIDILYTELKHTLKKGEFIMGNEITI